MRQINLLPAATSALSAVIRNAADLIQIMNGCSVLANQMLVKCRRRDGMGVAVEVKPRSMVDSFGRTIDYVRISVTDRCNLRSGCRVT